jgi:hypothetical protein
MRSRLPYRVFMGRFATTVGTRAGSIGLVLFLAACGAASADEAADQLERAQLLRELLETRPPVQSAPEAPSLPGARIETGPVRAKEAGRRQQFEDTQWRNLLGKQQMQTFAPSSQAIPASQWRQQTFERDRRAEDLSADILRRSQEYLSNGHR